MCTSFWSLPTVVSHDFDTNTPGVLAVAGGCTRIQDSASPDELSSSDSDLYPSSDLARLDLAQPDLSGKHGWTQVFVQSGLRLNSAWSSGPSDVYAVGLDGTILHSSGDDVWNQQKIGRLNELTPVYGSSASDVYAVESGSVLHSSRDGSWFWCHD